MAASWPRPSPAELARSSWARLLKSYTEVPTVYQAFFEPFRAAGRDLPYTVLAPAYEGLMHPTREKLISTFEQDLYILERSGHRFEVHGYPLHGIDYIQVRAVLLDSRITIRGVTRQGVSDSSTWKFNSVTDYLFAPILARMRLAGAEVKTAAPSEAAKFDTWAQLNLKFMNYARRSLLGDETVRCRCLQPEIRARRLTVLGQNFYRTLSPTHATILTDREIVLIREETRPRGNDRYGGIWEYLPLHQTTRVSLSERDNDLLVLSIQLTEGTRLTSVFQASAKEELNDFLAQYRELTGAPP